MSSAGLGLRMGIIREPGRSAIYRVAAGGSVDSLGSSAMAVAFGFFLYDRTGSAVWLSAWYFLSFGITGLLTPVAGWLADRFDRRRLIIISDLAAAACSLALIAVREPVALVSVAFIASIVGRIGHPAFGAALPNLAGKEELEWANGTMGVAFNIGSLIGPVVGGALYVAAG
jgi:MFS family permease